MTGGQIMGLRIRTNVSSLNAQRHLAASTGSVSKSIARLASGKRINKSADDAAGLAISDSLDANLRSIKVAKRNASDGISLVQTAEGGLVETGNMLIRLRELAVQASSDTISNKERGYLDKEFLQLKDEINRIARSTEFNGTRLLIGNSELGPETSNIEGAFPMEVQVGYDYYMDEDSTSQANPVNVIRIDFSNLNSLTHGEGSLGLGEATDGARIDKKVNAQNSLSQLDVAIGQVNNYRSYLGSIQNRLSSTINNLDVKSQNLAESKSRIIDTDFASETAALTQANILQQAGTSVLANANSLPQIALSLLNS
jgi:flagellin